ncbi:hypothetical protein LINPERPRIM_LOCUS14813 [Linum perenne]
MNSKSWMIAASSPQTSASTQVHKRKRSAGSTCKSNEDNFGPQPPKTKRRKSHVDRRSRLVPMFEQDSQFVEGRSDEVPGQQFSSRTMVAPDGTTISSPVEIVCPIGTCEQSHDQVTSVTQNRLANTSSAEGNLEESVVVGLKQMLDEYNVLAKSLRQIRTALQQPQNQTYAFEYQGQEFLMAGSMHYQLLNRRDWCIYETIKRICDLKLMRDCILHCIVVNRMLAILGE